MAEQPNTLNKYFGADFLTFARMVDFYSLCVLNPDHRSHYVQIYDPSISLCKFEEISRGFSEFSRRLHSSMLSLAELLNPVPDHVVPVTPPRQTGNRFLGTPSLHLTRTPYLSPGLSPSSTRQNVSVNRQTTVNVLYEYPSGTHIEFPETSSSGRVGHLFTGLDPENWVNPASAIAYSLGPPKGTSKSDGPCDILLDESGSRVPCNVSHYTCMYIPEQQYKFLFLFIL